MNTSYTKKRHIQESNQRLENRYLVEQGIDDMKNANIDYFFDDPEDWELQRVNAGKPKTNIPKSNDKLVKKQNVVNPILKITKDSNSSVLNILSRIPNKELRTNGRIERGYITFEKPIMVGPNEKISKLDISQLQPKSLSGADTNISENFMRVIIGNLNEITMFVKIPKEYLPVIKKFGNYRFVIFEGVEKNMYIIVLAPETQFFVYPKNTKTTETTEKINWKVYSPIWDFVKSTGSSGLVKSSRNKEELNRNWNTIISKARPNSEVLRLYDEFNKKLNDDNFSEFKMQIRFI
jgi:hypothetical protein